jgi:hypothetical protein
MQIYQITNLINDKIYIGKDEKDQPQYFGSGLIIKQAIKKYGKQNFKKEILDYCESPVELCNKEKFWIRKQESLYPKGYNISLGGNGGNILGNHPNKKEIVEKIRLKNKGQKRSIEFCQNAQRIALNVDPKIRKKGCEKAIKSRVKRIKEIGFSEKEIDAHKLNAKRLSDYNKSKEGKETISKLMKGKKKPAFTEDHRKNIGKASTGRKIPGKNISIENKEYESLHEASRILEIPLMTIRNRLINKKFSDWIYLDK